ncbi:MAG TPA: response regulator transcription factor [Terriglobia bacterium]|nr:response regulator transcription factor [Terriglobia bacterium]
MVREGLKGILEREGFQVVGEASDGQEALRLIAKLKPHIAIFDLAMPLLNGIEASRETLRVSPKTKTILLTMYKEDQYVLTALRAGVAGYILKTKAAKDLVQAIQQVQRGATYLSPEVSQTVVEAFRAEIKLPSESLTSRERQVLQLVAEGKTTKEVASILGISTKTAESHRTRLMRKLNIHETAGLVRYAIRMGLIQP